MRFISPILPLTLLLLVKSVYSLNNVYPSGARPAGMGNAFVSQFDLFSVFHNPAGLSKQKNTKAAFFFENRFLVKELSTNGLVVALPFRQACFALHYYNTGPALWKETGTGLAYAMPMSPRLSAGIQLHYFGFRLPEDASSAGSVSFAAGAIFQLSEKTQVGAQLRNAASAGIKNTSHSEKLPVVFSLGGHTVYAEHFSLSYQVEISQKQETQVMAGAEWEIAPRFFIRAGIIAPAVRLNAGAGYCWRRFTFDVAFNNHRYLGTSSMVAVSYHFNWKFHDKTVAQ